MNARIIKAILSKKHKDFVPSIRPSENGWPEFYIVSMLLKKAIEKYELIYKRKPDLGK